MISQMIEVEIIAQSSIKYNKWTIGDLFYNEATRKMFSKVVKQFS